ncbi:30S ribosomal protein S18 [Desulfurobacterium atlanticum]|uniref:Small ribosomal subunit protein bS18 n=1 Tax=Desulfurobacterium atlanticum TaxID=240169 RepID=A0A238ZGN0_9BACT|nr:30S ribosomal protein S18 [Desulfurobacterium atlanticum]SNR82487.1 small subunit ribosomal protein S18 [Desulfurobacterium atlanticum]
MAEQRRFIRRKKYCKFCAQKIEKIDYKNVELLKPFISERGRIIPRRISGVCSKHQRQLAKAVKRARHLALLPFVKVD